MILNYAHHSANTNINNYGKVRIRIKAARVCARIRTDIELDVVKSFIVELNLFFSLAGLLL